MGVGLGLDVEVGEGVGVGLAQSGLVDSGTHTQMPWALSDLPAGQADGLWRDESGASGHGVPRHAPLCGARYTPDAKGYHGVGVALVASVILDAESATAL